MEIALGLDEIRRHVGAFLDKQSLYASRLVNREWHASLQAYFWARLDFCRRKSRGLEQVLPWVLEQSHHIRSLILPGAMSVTFFTSTLRLCTRRSEGHPEQGLLQSLKVLKVVRVVKPMGEVFWKAVGRGCPGLGTVYLKGGLMDRKGFWALWREILLGGRNGRVRTLVWGKVFVDALEGVDRKDALLAVHPQSLQQGDGGNGGSGGAEEEEEATVAPRVAGGLTRVTIKCSNGIPDLHLVDLLRLCPNLAHLDISQERFIGHPEFLSSLQEKTVWPEFESLSVCMSSLQDEQISKVLAHMPRIVHLELDNCFGPLSFQSLRYHPHSLSTVLVSLNLSGHFHSYRSEQDLMNGSKMVRTILEEGTRLRDLRVNAVLTSQDLLESSDPWPCIATMRILGLQIGMITSGTNRESLAAETRAILKRLSALTRLETLAFSYDGWTRTIDPLPYSRIQICLNHGLDQLESLQSLEKIYFMKSSKTMEEEDVEWMLDHWPWVKDVGFWTDRVLDLESKTGLSVRAKKRHFRFYQAR